MQLRMTGTNVLIRQVECEEVTSGGVILPDEKQLKAEAKGEVISIGPAVSEISVGDTAYFGDYAGEILTMEGRDHIILREGDILAKEPPA